MARQLILHIGYPKTGTTALQQFWQLNEGFLRENGLLYPSAGRIHAAHYGFSYRLDHLGDAALDQFPPLEALIAALRDEMDGAGVDRALISSEYFIKAADPQTVRAAFADFDVTILLYLRRHDHFFESGYGQSVVSAPSPPWDNSIGSFILHQLGAGQFSYDYLVVLRRWASVFGKEKIIVRAYQESAEHDIFAESLLALGITARGDLRIPGRPNTAMSYATIYAVDAVQRADVPAAYKRAIVDQLILAGRATPEASRPTLLSPNDRVALVARYRHVYATIAREYLDQADGVLFTEAAPQRDPAWRPPTPPDALALTDMLLRAAAAVAGKEGEAEPRRADAAKPEVPLIRRRALGGRG
jgi:hypothetical protein